MGTHFSECLFFLPFFFFFFFGVIFFNYVADTIGLPAT